MAAKLKRSVLNGGKVYPAGTEATDAGPEAAAEAPMVSPPARRVLVLTGPADADLDSAVTAIRAALAPGLSLENEPPKD